MNAWDADTFSHGHGALQVFDGSGFAATPLWVQAWLVFLVTTFIVSFAFALKRPIARWAAGGFIASTSLGQPLFALLSLPFLGGAIAIMHLVCWTPALVVLLAKRPFLDPNESKWFRVWSGTMVFAIAVSFMFDIRDAALYVEYVTMAQ
jgi:hypothetical protein